MSAVVGDSNRALYVAGLGKRAQSLLLSHPEIVRNLINTSPTPVSPNILLSSYRKFPGAAYRAGTVGTDLSAQSPSNYEDLARFMDKVMPSERILGPIPNEYSTVDISKWMGILLTRMLMIDSTIINENPLLLDYINASGNAWGDVRNLGAGNMCYIKLIGSSKSEEFTGPPPSAIIPTRLLRSSFQRGFNVDPSRINTDDIIEELTNKFLLQHKDLNDGITGDLIFAISIGYEGSIGIAMTHTFINHSPVDVRELSGHYDNDLSSSSKNKDDPNRVVSKTEFFDYVTAPDMGSLPKSIFVSGTTPPASVATSVSPQTNTQINGYTLVRDEGIATGIHTAAFNAGRVSSENEWVSRLSTAMKYSDNTYVVIPLAYVSIGRVNADNSLSEVWDQVLASYRSLYQKMVSNTAHVGFAPHPSLGRKVSMTINRLDIMLYGSPSSFISGMANTDRVIKEMPIKITPFINLSYVSGALPIYSNAAQFISANASNGVSNNTVFSLGAPRNNSFTNTNRTAALPPGTNNNIGRFSQSLNMPFVVPGGNVTNVGGPSTTAGIGTQASQPVNLPLFNGPLPTNISPGVNTNANPFNVSPSLGASPSPAQYNPFASFQQSNLNNTQFTASPLNAPNVAQVAPMLFTQGAAGQPDFAAFGRNLASNVAANQAAVQASQSAAARN